MIQGFDTVSNFDNQMPSPWNQWIIFSNKYKAKATPRSGFL